MAFGGGSNTFGSNPSSTSSSANATASNLSADTSMDLELPEGHTDSISCLHWSPCSDLLAASSWSGEVRVWEVSPTGQVAPRYMYKHDGPVLHCRFNKAGTKIASCDGANMAKVYDLSTQQAQVVAQHDAPIRSVRWHEENNQCILITGSWDKTVKYWNMQTSTPIGTVQFPERVYTMDTNGVLLVVGTADRNIHIINLTQNPNTILHTTESPLKFQTRVITCFPDKYTIAVASIEGRCAIQTLDDKYKSECFTFKCHRDGNASSATIHQINDITIHPQYGSFGTCGSDGAIHFWDKDNRTRLKMFNSAGKGSPVSAIGFNCRGTILAYAVSYDWSRGHEYAQAPGPGLHKIMIHALKEEDVKSKPKKK